jgi:hypothetical protein
MNDNKKTWLKPIDPYYTVEIDFSDDIESIREQIEELKNQHEKRVSPNEEADPSEEASPDTNE